MANKYYVLTEEDRELLRFFKKEIEGKRKTPNKNPSTTELGSALHTYIAFTPVDGIPGRVADVPGVAECVIYRVTKDIDNTRRLVAMDTLSKTVINLSSDAIEGSKYVTIERESYGEWVVTALNPGDIEPGTGTGTGGSSTLIEVITDVCFAPRRVVKQMMRVTQTVGDAYCDTPADCCPDPTPGTGTGTGTSPDNGGPGGYYYPCYPVSIEEVDVFCETSELPGTGTGTATPIAYLRLYRRQVLLAVNPRTGCLEKSYTAWSMVRTIGCCDPSCVEPGTGTGIAGATCCDNGTLYDSVNYSLSGPTIPNCGECTLSGTLYQESPPDGMVYTNSLGGSTCDGRGFLDLTLYCLETPYGLHWRARGKLRRFLFNPLTDTTQDFDVAMTVIDSSPFPNTTLGATIDVPGCGSDMTLLITNPCHKYVCVDGLCNESAYDTGVYATLAECEAACTEPPVSTACCPVDDIPAVLYGTFTGKTGYATNFPDTVVFTHIGAGVWQWIMTGDCGFGPNELSMSCVNPDFTLTSGGTNIGPATQAADGGGSCNPFEQTWTVSGSYGCGAASYVLTITE